MDKVGAYRCEECEDGYSNKEPFTKWIKCHNCKGTRIVWLTEEEVRDRELIADHENKDSGCCGNGCGTECKA